MNIVVIEDNENVRESVTAYLELEGYSVAGFSELKTGHAHILNHPVDLIVLDAMLPDGDGFLLAKKLKENTDIPLIFLTARTTESDRITGLEIGADDYVIKPFSPKELVLRVGAVLKRTSKESAQPVSTVRFVFEDSALEIEEERHLIRLNGKTLNLTTGEWNILTYLSQYPGQVFSRMRILENCLESMAEGSERTVDTHIKNIRHKLDNPGWIETVRGFGYRFSGEPA